MSNKHEDVPADDAIASALRSALTRTADTGKSTPTEWVRVHARGRRRVVVRRVAAVSALVVVIAGAVGVAAAAAHDDRRGVSVVDSVSTPKTESARRERAAVALANKMLGQALLPPDAQRSTVTPPVLGGSFVESSLAGKLIATHQIWTSRTTWASVAAYARTHVPPGLSVTSRSYKPSPNVRVLTVTQSLSRLPANIFRAELDWGVIDAKNGGSVFRIDAIVGWNPAVTPGVPRAPALRVTVRSGCPAALGKYQDVDNAVGARGPHLLPSGAPTGALMCSYISRDSGAMLFHTYDAADATTLAAALNRIETKPDVGVHSCPMDLGVVTILAFSYDGRADADVWWHSSGCPSLDNGYVTATETANPSFYNDFTGVMRNLGN